MANYSTIPEFRSNVGRIPIAVMADVEVTDKIAQAEDIIKSDLSGVIDFVVVDAAVTVPNYIRMLSQYKVAEMCIVSTFGAKRMVEDQSDRQYWERMYKELKKSVLAGNVPLGAFGLAGGTFQNNVREKITPALGTGEFGGHLTEAEREAQNDEFGSE